MNEPLDGIPGPCQPIGCDNGHHLTGCYYADIDLALADGQAALMESLDELEAEDAAVREAAQLLDDTAHSILSTGAENRRLRAELGSALSRLGAVTDELATARARNELLDNAIGVARLSLAFRGRALQLVQAELASARQELSRRRQRLLLVARDGGRDCLSCDREIRRGEAYELRGDLGPDQLEHVHCPDPAPPIPSGHHEVMAWFAHQGLDPAAPPVTVFAHLRAYLNQSDPSEGATPA